MTAEPILIVLGIAGVLAVAAVLRAQHLADAVVGVDTVLLILVSMVAVDAAANQRATYLDVPLVVGLLGFLGTATAAVYLRRRSVQTPRSPEDQR